jgi:hypothetical protein
LPPEKARSTTGSGCDPRGRFGFQIPHRFILSARLSDRPDHRSITLVRRYRVFGEWT